MNKFILILSLSLLYLGRINAQYKNKADDSFLFKNYHQSALLWQKVVQAYGGKELLAKNICFKSKGIIQYMGHYDTPEKVFPMNFEDDSYFLEDKQSIYIRSNTEFRGRKSVNSTLLNKDSLFTFESNKLYSKGGTDKNMLLSSILKSAPSKLILFVNDNLLNLRILKEDKKYYLFSSVLNNSSICLYINKKTFLLERLESIRYDNLLGEIVKSIFYENYQYNKGLMLPSIRTDYEGGRLERNYVFSNYQLDIQVDTSMMILPLNLKNTLLPITSKPSKLAFEKLTENIHLVKFLTADNKSLVVDMGESIAIFESFADVNLNKQMLDSVSKLYPNKPIKTLFVTHHHPDHAGGIKAFANRNITIVTTKSNPIYFQKLINAIHFSKGVYTEKDKVKYDLVDNESEKAFGNDNYKVVAYEIGKNTDHTQEHLVFYFPKDKILWTGDLLYFPDNGKIYPAGNRGKAINNLILSKKLLVDKIYTAWPLNNQKPFISLDDLSKTINLLK